MELRNKKVKVFCSASNAIEEEYKKVTEELGILLAQNSCHLIYGGNKNGLIRIIIDAVLDNGGKVTAILPKSMQEQFLYERLIDK